MNFIFDYLLSGLIFGFKATIKWTLILAFAFGQLFLLLYTSNFFWGIFIFIGFIAVDVGIIQACLNYAEDKERIQMGLLPIHRKRKS